jgi:hypothetical protein
MTARGPARSINRPISGLTAPETRKPNEKAPAVTPRSHPNSPMMGGKNSGAGVHPDRHGDERHDDDDPAVKEGKPHQITYLVIPRCANPCA